MRAKLKELVGDPSAEQWSLRADERQRLARAAGSLDVLREARGDEPLDGPGQRAIDRVLDGPPYDLAEVDDDALPYWLQAVRWFAAVEPALPTAVEVSDALERRRVRGRLVRAVGPGFRGRQAEMEQMADWYADGLAGPQVITGIGGAGKSALIAKFALERPAAAVLLWLDFDRADLAPDDALSVLRSLGAQVSAQVEGFTAPSLPEEDWARAVDDFGDALAAALPTNPPPLLVLDGFEVAQHVRRHDEIWRMLERLVDRVPTMRVIVSGRAPVGALRLSNRDSRSLHLSGLTPEVARSWLRERGITDQPVVDWVLKMSRGIPLILKLVLRFVDEGGAIEDLPAKLPRKLVEGVLYRRILDRVIDPALRPLARDALVLRRLTEPMIGAVLADRVPPGIPLDAVLAQLSREMGLVERVDTPADPETPAIALIESVGALLLRPEVRAATLRLLELDDAARVRTIDQRAAAWYARQDRNDITVAAELVYHRLRLGDLPGARRAWRDECAPLLLHAEEELPEKAMAARAWLRSRTTGASEPRIRLVDWERDAEARIRSALGRGLLRAVPQILGERTERGDASPLVFYDAWIRWQDGDVAGARLVLERAPDPGGVVGRDRAVLGALLAREAGDRPAADEMLMWVSDPIVWDDRSFGHLAVQAARIRLTVDLDAELALSGLLADPGCASTMEPVLRRFLTPADVVLPSLSGLLRRFGQMDMLNRPILVPIHLRELEGFASKLEADRLANAGSDAPAMLSLAGTPVAPGPREAWTAREANLLWVSPSGFGSEAIDLALDLATLAWRRWRLVASTLFLAEAHQLVAVARPESLQFAVLGTLGALHGRALTWHYSDLASIDELMWKMLRHSFFTVYDGQEKWPDKVRQMLEREALWPRDDLSASTLWRVLPPGGIATEAYLLSPDPLETLCRRLAGVPVP